MPLAPVTSLSVRQRKNLVIRKETLNCNLCSLRKAIFLANIHGTNEQNISLSLRCLFFFFFLFFFLFLASVLHRISPHILVLPSCQPPARVGQLSYLSYKHMTDRPMNFRPFVCGRAQTFRLLLARPAYMSPHRCAVLLRPHRACLNWLWRQDTGSGGHTLGEGQRVRCCSLLCRRPIT